jgi:glycosyltransferase involved in cell wall biosynthesis
MTATGAKREFELSGASPEKARSAVRVCLVVDSLGPDAGTEKLVAGLASSIDPNVVETHLCCFEPSERLASLPPHVKTAVFSLSRINSVNGLRQVLRFRRYLKSNRIDVVHSFMNKSAIFSVLASRGTACRTVVTSRLSCGYWYTRKLIWMFRILNHYSTHILTNSATAKRLTVDSEGVSPDKITVFYPGVDLRRFSSAASNPARASALGIPAGAAVVGIVANFRPVKDLPLFLRTAAVIAAAVPNAAFLLVGQGALKAKLQELAAELGIGDRVFFSSPDVEVADYLARMSVACLTSESEGLPNAVLEYMAAGLPVVSTDVGGISELVRNGFTGYLVGTRTPEAFAEPVIQLLQNERLRKGMGQLGLERARAEFDSSAAIARLQQFYLKAAAAVQPRATTTTPLSAVPTD